MRFTISYRLTSTGPTRWTVTWADGKISGHDGSLACVRGYLKAFTGKPFALSPTGPRYDGNPLADGLAFLVFCRNVLLGVRVSGQGPTLPAEPPEFDGRPMVY